MMPLPTPAILEMRLKTSAACKSFLPPKSRNDLRSPVQGHTTPTFPSYPISFGVLDFDREIYELLTPCKQPRKGSCIRRTIVHPSSFPTPGSDLKESREVNRAFNDTSGSNG